MTALIRELCALSVFCGLALCLTPEGSGRKATALCCALALLLPLVTALRDFDYKIYAPELSRYREMGRALSEEGEARSERLQRQVIEAECAAAVEESAAALGLRVTAEVRARWDTGGFWVPEKVRLSGAATQAQRAALGERIAAELGVPPAQQEWVNGDAAKTAE